jgi:hypothetical protein
MSEPTPQIRRTLTSRTERKELLALACDVDRGSWRLACRPAGGSGRQLAISLLEYAEAFSPLLPERLARWLRGASFLTNLGRQLGWLRL